MKIIKIILITTIFLIFSFIIPNNSKDKTNLNIEIINITYTQETKSSLIDIQLKNNGNKLDLTGLVLILYDYDGNEYAQTGVNVCSMNSCEILQNETISTNFIVGIDASKTSRIGYKIIDNSLTLNKEF